MIKSLLRRVVAASAGALVFVGTSATVASADPDVWQTTKVTDLALVDQLVLIPLAFGIGIALLVWTYLTARERATAKVATRSGDKG